jgi:VanZ family protein
LLLLLLTAAALIAYGSLYPFNFDLAAYGAGEIHRLLTVDPLGTTRGDILGNVVLFAPLGLLGAAVRAGGGTMRVLSVLLLGLAFAAALQVAQLFLPSRVPTLTDVVWNGLGLALGAAATAVPLVRRLLQNLERNLGTSVPGLLIAAWLGYRLAPFVPSVDFQLVKDSLKPLLLRPQLSALGVFHDFVAWSIVLHLWASVRRVGARDRLALLLIAGVLAAEVFILDNTVSASNVAGAFLAVVVWWLALHRVPARASGLAALLLALLVLQGLAPFDLRAAPASFHWVPFAGALGGNMMTAVISLLEKLFLYGSLIWLLLENRAGWTRAALATAGTLALIEAAQTRFAGHTPEITDPLLAVLLVVLLFLLSGGRRAPATATS